MFSIGNFVTSLHLENVALNVKSVYMTDSKPTTNCGERDFGHNGQQFAMEVAFKRKKNGNHVRMCQIKDNKH